jgi:hypothetical protein
MPSLQHKQVFKMKDPLNPWGYRHVPQHEVSVIEQVKSDMRKSFDMIDLGLLHECLGVEVWKTSSNIFFSQTKYSRSLFGRYRKEN